MTERETGAFFALL